MPFLFLFSQKPGSVPRTLIERMPMKKHLLITVVFLFSFACGATEKKIVTEVIDPYYQPKRVYSVGGMGWSFLRDPLGCLIRQRH